MSTATRGKKPIIPEEKLPPSFRRAKPVVLPQKGYNDYSESELVDQFTPMVIKWVHRLAYHPSLKQEMDDLRNIGLTALIKAKRNFKPELKVPFVAYCSTRIRGAILDAIRKRFAGSRTIGAKLRKVENAIYELSGNLDRPPTEEEVADHLSLSVDNYRNYLTKFKRVFTSPLTTSGRVSRRMRESRRNRMKNNRTPVSRRGDTTYRSRSGCVWLK